MSVAAVAPRLLLASGSPRRRELLTAAGYRFEVCPAPVEESVSGQLTATELVRLNARRKARAGARLPPETVAPTVVLGADTLVSLEGLVLGKPRDLGEAFDMLSRLVGRTHEVLTGVCLFPGGRGAGPTREWVERTAVTFRSLDAGGIRAYLARINPLDKAGAYAAQEHGAEIIAATAGSWSNVVGLPMESLGKELAELGILTDRVVERSPVNPHAMHVIIDDLRGPEIAGLLTEHLEDMARVSPPESRHALNLDGLRQPGITFWSVWQGSELVGCGALKDLGAGQAEVKSMRTARAHHRKGVAAFLLQHLIAQARERGYHRLNLETGSMKFFEPAHRLYAKYGFKVCGPFADYVADPNSVFMTRTL